MRHVRHISFDADPSDMLQSVSQYPVTQKGKGGDLDRPHEGTEESQHGLDFGSGAQEEEATHHAGHSAAGPDDDAGVGNGANRIAKDDVGDGRQNAKRQICGDESQAAQIALDQSTEQEEEPHIAQDMGETGVQEETANGIQ